MRKTLSTALSGVIALFGFTGLALANPSSFATAISTSAATSSPSYMTPGRATTTTPVYDAYSQTANGGFTSKADYAGLLVQFSASSTASILGITAEYSQDGIDWYQDFVVDPNQIATSTGPTFSLVNPFAFSWKFASSTLGGISPSSTSNRATAALLVPTPFRYTRLVFSMTGGNGAVWASLLPIKQQR
jgi:hypothetical protein